MNEWIEIARTGTFKDMSGQEAVITEDRLKALASTSVEGHRVPLVIGHPKANDPAYGWVDTLKIEGNKLLARFKQVTDKVKELVRSGHYKNVSMRTSPDLGRLIHVGLLGATPPAIDSLGAVAMSGQENGLTIELSGYDFSKEDTMELEQLKQRVKDLEAKLNEAESEKQKLADQVKAKDSEFAAYKQGVEQKTREQRAETLVKDGKILPADKGKLLELASALASSEKILEFAGEGGKVEKISAEEAFWRELETRDKNYHGLFTEFAAPRKKEEQEEGPVNLAGKF